MYEDNVINESFLLLLKYRENSTRGMIAVYINICIQIFMSTDILPYYCFS